MSVAELDPAAVSAALGECALIGQGEARIEVHAALDSTMEAAAALANEGAAEGSLVLALEQRAGRGRRGRTWTSPPGGLYASLILRPDEGMLRRLPVTLLGGLALVQAVDDVGGGARADLKWPNDVLVGGQKLAGILGELSKGAGGHVLILGLGVNVATSAEALAPEAGATSLAAHGTPPALATLLGAFARRFEELYLSVRRGGGAAILSEASARMPLLGKTVRLRLPDRVVEGTACGLNATGGLVLEVDGAREVFVAGEVEEVRAA